MVMEMAQGPITDRPTHVPEDRVVDIDIYNLPGSREDYHQAWKDLQDSGVHGLIWTPRNEGHWIATSGRLIHSIFADYQRFSSSVIIVPKSMGQHDRLPPITLDPPHHRQFRILLSNGISPKAVTAREGMIRSLCRELIEGFYANGGCNFTTDLAEQLPIRVFMDMVDLPLEEAEQIKFYVDHITRPDAKMSFEDAMKALIAYVAPVAAARRGGSGLDLITFIANGKIGERKITEVEAAELSAQLLIGGVDTVVNLLSFIMLHLARHPDHRNELIADPSLIPDAVEEFVRRFPIIADGREISEDMEYEGVLMKKGEMIVLPTALHGLDSRENECPMIVDFHRPSSQHSTFGNGPHKCPGALLARAEMRIVIEEWLTRIPQFSVEPGADITFSAGVVGAIDALPLVWLVSEGHASLAHPDAA
jgi:cytochrome P450